MKRIILSILFLGPIMALAQEIKELKFVEEEHDFGLIKEEAGPAEYKFEFTNTAAEPIMITNVRASCGCTTPAWTKDPVRPGEKGFIKAVYNPRNRPGPFHKTLTVTTNGQQGTIILRIQGKVEPKPRTIEDDFPTIVGNLRTKYRAFNMGKVYNNEPATRTFEVYNQGEENLTFLDNTEAAAYIKVEFNPQTLGPKQKGQIILTYDSKAKNDLGFSSEQLVIYTDEPGAEQRKVFTVYADLNEYFEPLTPETAALAPKLNIGERVFDFGRITQGEVVNTTFTLENTGKSALNIRKVASNCTCAITEISKQDIEPGESVELKVSFDTKGRRGTQQKSITIYSSDPVSPVQRLILKASIQVPSN